MGKRGQVTLFIILGVVVLLLISIFLYLYQSQKTQPEIIEPEFMPIKNYVEECMNIITEDALRLLGTQGGYIELPQEINLDPNSYINFGNGIIKLPYWYYKASNRMPLLNKDQGSPSIQEQLENYVTKNLETCLKDFVVFEDRFEIKPSKKIKTEFSIGDDFVNVYVEYKLKIKDITQNKIGYVTQFHKEFPLQLKKIYDVAQKIMQEENDKMYFETMTIDLMSMNTNIPFSGLTFDCNGKQWFLSKIKDEVKDMLYYNIPLIRVYNTDYPPFLENPSTYEEFRKYTTEDFFNDNYPKELPPEDAYEYFNYLWDMKIPQNDLKVGFLFLRDWNFDINAYPSDNGILKSNVAKGAKQFLSFMCLNMYHFTYDIEYPVQVVIRDDSAFFNKGYNFQFAFPILIDHNNGNREKIGTTFFETLIPFSGYCDNLGGNIYDIRAKGMDEFGITDVEINDVNISYNCLKFRCDLGKTKPDGGVYRLKTQLPTTCAHGYITAEKEGYLKGETQVLDSTSVDVNMRKLKKFNFSMVLNKYRGGVIDPDEDFTSNLVAYMTLQSYEEPSLLMYKSYPFDEDSTEEDTSITIIEENSKYKIDIFIIDELDGLIIGGYRCNWTVDYNDMQGKNDVVFHIVEYLPKPMTDEKQYEMIQFLDTGSYCENLRPEFSTSKYI